MIYFRLAEFAVAGSIFTHRESLLMLAGLCLMLWASRKVRAWGREL